MDREKFQWNIGWLTARSGFGPAATPGPCTDTRAIRRLAPFSLF